VEIAWIQEREHPEAHEKGGKEDGKRTMRRRV
jgi:hypothetical protein